MANKGYPSGEKLDNTRQNYANVNPTGPKTYGLETKAILTYTAYSTADAAEAGTTTQDVVATAHGAKVGDQLVWLAGAANEGVETVIVEIIDVDTMRLGQLLPATPVVGDTFNLLRPKALQVSAGGGLAQGPVQFVLDTVDTEVEEDTGTPANNRPLPVKLITSDGENPTGAGSVDTATLRTTPADDSPHLLAARHEAAATPLSNRLSNGAAFYNAAMTGHFPSTLGQTTAAGSNSVVLASDQPTIPTDQQGKTSVEIVRNDYSSTNVTTGAYVELIASTSGEINRLHIFDSSGEIMILATGAAASETDIFYIEPGGPGPVDVNIPAGTRVSVRALSADATLGDLVINGLS